MIFSTVPGRVALAFSGGLVSVTAYTAVARRGMTKQTMRLS